MPSSNHASPTSPRSHLPPPRLPQIPGLPPRSDTSLPHHTRVFLFCPRSIRATHPPPDRLPHHAAFTPPLCSLSVRRLRRHGCRAVRLHFGDAGIRRKEAALRTGAGRARTRGKTAALLSEAINIDSSRKRRQEGVGARVVRAPICGARGSEHIGDGCDGGRGGRVSALLLRPFLLIFSRPHRIHQAHLKAFVDVPPPVVGQYLS